MFLADVRPANPNDTATHRALDNESYIEGMRRAGPGAVVYVITTTLPDFIGGVLPKIGNTAFVLVTGSSDVCPVQLLGAGRFRELAEDPRLLRWFAQNLALAEQHPKLEQLPIGLDYHTLKDQGHLGWGGQASPKAQEAALLSVRSAAPAFRDRAPRVFLGPMSASDPLRATVFTRLTSSQIADVARKHMLRTAFWQNASRYQFVASPRGHGIDCHRTWEILALGSVPLVSAGPHSEIFGRLGLPAVQVADSEWGALPEARMREVAQAIQGAPNTLPPALTVQYWAKKFRAAALQYWAKKFRRASVLAPAFEASVPHS